MSNKENIKSELTLSDIKHDYLKYGYLSDVQVEWLMEKLTMWKDVAAQLETHADIDHKEGIVYFRMGKELYEELRKIQV